MDNVDEAIARLIEEARDSRRPALGDVLDLMTRAFSRMGINVRPVVSGPVTWVWEDLEMGALGFPKFFSVSAALEPGLEGYPILTIRQAYSVRFDTWITFSCLVVGPDAESISHSVTMAVTNHAGMFASVKYVNSVITANRHSPMAGMVAIKRLMEEAVPIISSDDERTEANEMIEAVPTIDPDPGLVN